MSVVQLLPALLARGVQVRAVGYDDVVAAVGRGLPDRLVLAHEQDGDAGREAAEGRRRELRRGGRGERPDGGEDLVGSRGGDVVPGSGVGKLGLELRRLACPPMVRRESRCTKPLV